MYKKQSAQRFADFYDRFSTFMAFNIFFFSQKNRDICNPLKTWTYYYTNTFFSFHLESFSFLYLKKIQQKKIHFFSFKFLSLPLRIVFVSEKYVQKRCKKDIILVHKCTKHNAISESIDHPPFYNINYKLNYFFSSTNPKRLRQYVVSVFRFRIFFCCCSCAAVVIVFDYARECTCNAQHQEHSNRNNKNNKKILLYVCIYYNFFFCLFCV